MVNPLADIQHIIVLMLENRSFDHMLGFMKSQIPSLDGLNGTEWNPEDASNPVGRIPVSSDAGYLDLQVDPSHWTPDVLDQIYSVYKCGTKPPTLPTVGPNMSFVANYSYRNNNSLPAAHKIMRCFTPGNLPALTTLAREFAVCDAWYSSMPGQTWPNRIFVHAATSDGHIDNKLYDYDIDTIYQHLEAASRSWNIYFHDIPQALALKRLRGDAFKDRFQLFHQFLADARNGNLPNYSFIEPRYFDFAFKRANDQHPNHDVSLGDVLIADVYEALRNSPQWEQTLLLILWDEHGGIYDHAFPKQPQVPCPDAKVSVDPPFGFDLVGVRVPAVLISPYIARGAVDHTQYEHASVSATLKSLFGLSGFLTKRDEASNTFESIISLSAPRMDTPPMLPRIPAAANGAARANKLPFLLNTTQQLEAEAAGVISTAPLSDFQESLVEIASNITTAGTVAPSAIKEMPRIEHAAGEHVRTFASEYFGIPERAN
jgi:phospholipase C